jgi:hypothetical protein
MAVFDGEDSARFVGVSAGYLPELQWSQKQTIIFSNLGKSFHRAQF